MLWGTHKGTVMLGWWIVIGPDNGQGEPVKEATLARWETGVGGRRWLDDLVATGRAQALRRDGYPCRYTARAADVFPLIKSSGIRPSKNGAWVLGVDEGEAYVQPPDWIGPIELHADRLAACPPDQVLLIDAWDQS